MTPPMRSDDATTREGVQIPEGAHVVIQVPPMPESELVKHLQDMYVQVQRDLSRYRVDAMNEAQRRRAAEDERDDLEREATTLAAEVERVKGAVRWALGEGDSDFGASLGDRAPGDGKLPRIGRYWWRAELRKRAGLDAPRGEM